MTLAPLDRGASTRLDAGTSSTATLIGLAVPTPVLPPGVVAADTTSPSSAGGELPKAELSNGAPPSEPATSVPPSSAASSAADRSSISTASPASLSTRAPHERARGGARGWIAAAAVLGVAVIGGRLYMAQTSTPQAATPEIAAAQPLTEQAPRPSAKPAAEELRPPTPAEGAARAVDAQPSIAGGAPSGADPTPATGAEPPPATSAQPAPSPAPAASSASDEKRVVVVTISPPKARLFRKGKPVGSSPVTIELAPGEKRAYEVGAPGFRTRKLVVDGTKPEIFIGLRPEK